MNNKYKKTIFFVCVSMVIGSVKAWAESSSLLIDNDTIAETREFLLTGDGIVLVFFLLWIAYIVFCFPGNTLKKL